MNRTSRVAVVVAVLIALAALFLVVVCGAGDRHAAPPAPATDNSALEDEVKRLRRENAELREKLERRGRVRSEPRAEVPETRADARAEAAKPGTQPSRVLIEAALTRAIEGAVVPDPALDGVSVADLVERLRSALLKGDATAARSLEAALARRGAESVDPLLNVVRDMSAPVILRDAALRVLTKLDAPGLATVVENLYLGAKDDPAMTPARREQALSAAVVADPQSASAVVQRLLWSSDAADHDVARAALGAAHDPVFLPILRDQVMRPEAARSGAAIADAIAAIRGDRWSALQATGEPDTPVSGDIGAAWASKEADMGEVWLELGFESAVTPQSVRIRETYNPGAVARIEAVLAGGTRETLWEGRADAAAAPRWFEPALRSASAPVRTIRIVLDTNRVPGWNEIDAVELLGDGRRQWASEARASSSYSDR